MKFRFAIMGAGNIAGKFCDAVNLVQECEVTAVASKSLERAAGFAAAFHIKNAYSNYEDLLKKEEVDCVYIATTPDSHFFLSRLCMKYKVPVLCEKAMFMNSRDAEEIFALSSTHRVFAMEAMWSRFLPAIETAKQWIAEGKLGEPNFLNIMIGCAFNRVRNSRNFDPKLGGGAAFDLTVYAYELTELFWGTDIQKKTVLTTWEESGIDVINQIHLTYEGKQASLVTSCVSAMEEKLMISGTEGRLEIPHPHYAEEVSLYDRHGKLIQHYADTQTQNGFVYEIREVMSCIRNGAIESLVVPHELTLGCAKLFDEIYSSRN